MRRPWLILLVAPAACYAPAVPTGAPCTEDSDCPSPLVCRTTTLTCETSQAADDASPPDTPDDSQATGCWGAWLDGTVRFTMPTRVESLRVAGTSSFNASLSFDMLTIYLTRGGDQFRATRPTRDAAFDTPQVLVDLQTAEEDSRISTTADQLLGVFASSRTGTQGMLDLWQTTRASTSAPFGGITATPFAMFNDASQQFDPELSPDGLAIYWAPPVENIQAIHRASRPTIGAAFGNETILPISIPGIVDLFDPSISPDERVLVVAGQGTTPDVNLFFVTRPSAGAAFSAAVLVPDVNSDSREGDPEVTTDGCTLYFSSNRDGGQTDIYSADVIR